MFLNIKLKPIKFIATGIVLTVICVLFNIISQFKFWNLAPISFKVISPYLPKGLFRKI